MHTDVHTVTVAERRYRNGDLDEREVLIFSDGHKLFATFEPTGSVDLLKVFLTSGKNDAMIFPRGFMDALYSEYTAFLADIQQQKSHTAFLAAKQAAEAMTAEPLTLEQQYHAGLLTDDEFLRLAEEEAHDPTKEKPAWFHAVDDVQIDDAGEMNLKIDGEWQQATREAADNAELLHVSRDDLILNNEEDAWWQRQHEAGFDAETIKKHKDCGPECPVQRALAAENAEQLPDVPVAFSPHSRYPMDQREAADNAAPLCTGCHLHDATQDGLCDECRAAAEEVPA